MPDEQRWLPVYVGLGSNLGDSPATLRAALAAIGQLDQVYLASRSSLYRSAPLGPSDQPDYCNAVAALLTRLAPGALLKALHGIEESFGRVRGGDRWGPRTLDLDLLLYADRALDGPDLVVPHPGLAQRNFVLYPLAEIAPDIRIPGFGPLSRLVAATDTAGLRKME